MNLTFHRSLVYLFISILVFSMAQNAYAHKGHAGPMVMFMKNKLALKSMLPDGAKIVKRKQPLKDKAIEWAEKTYDVELDEKVYRYYLATDRKSGDVLGAAYVSKIHYRHGDLKFAVGIDASGRITQAAILGVNEKYVVDFEGSVGKGLIKSYAGLSLKDLIFKTDKLASSNKAARELAVAVRDAVILLVALTRE